MPIFMDRHDLSGLTPEQVAEAHLKDLQVQDAYGVRFLTYWLDQQRGSGFCLIDAPDEETAVRVHREAHGNIPLDLIEVSLTAVEAFLGRISDPQPASASAEPAIGPGFRTVMFTDIVGSTEMTARVGDAMAVELVRAHDALVRRALKRHGGREVKHTGDGIMASFEDSASAIGCARMTQEAFAEYRKQSGEPLHVRVGLAAGEPIEDSNDLFGTTVQLAARLCDVADADQIMVSEQVQKHQPQTHAFIDAGRQRLHGFAAPQQLFQLAWQ